MITEVLNEYSELAYTIAHSKGFFSDNRDDSAYIVAIHEELSEAFSAWNKHKGWYAIEPKPDGVYFELTDAVIRILSYSGYKGFSLQEKTLETDRPYMQDDLCDMIAKCHLDIAQYYELLNKEARDDFEEQLQLVCMQGLLSTVISRIEDFIVESSNDEFNLCNLIDTKLAYNSKRSMKHGGNEV